MKLAIIGAGNVGGALGTAWAQKAGHEICFGVRDQKADKTQALLRAIGAKARAGTAAEAAAFADIIVLAMLWPAAETAIRAMGSLKGKVILDATNPLTRGPDGISLEIGHSISAGEKVQGWAAGASVFKTLNTTGFGNMANSASTWWTPARCATRACWRRTPCCGSTLRLPAARVAISPLQS